MKRFLIGAIWGVIFYVLGFILVGAIVGAQAVDSWNPVIALIAAALAAAGAWKGWCCGNVNLSG
jgi:hypothetical protein